MEEVNVITEYANTEIEPRAGIGIIGIVCGAVCLGAACGIFCAS